MNRVYLIALAGFSLCSPVNAQTAFSTKEYIDINNIRAASLVHGDMWWDPAGQSAECEFPKGSGINLNFVGGIWMAGYDSQGQLKVSAQTYRQSGNDYWPGPLDNTGSLDYNTSAKWARIWKVNRADIDAFIALPNHTQANTPATILEWPAKGNAYAKDANGAQLNISNHMAPFVDVNFDGTYNPLDGDYPEIKGDQALWWVFSDNGPTHNNVASEPLRMEVQAMAFAFNTGTVQDNIIYYQFDVFNRSVFNYQGFSFAFFNDLDVGYFNDDYVGFDSSRRLAIGYNGNTQDGNGGPGQYGNTPPMMGMAFLQLPGDVLGTYKPLGSFMTHDNSTSNINGNPASANDFYNYMHATWRNNTHLKNPFTSQDANYIYPGAIHPGNGDWSECSMGNPYGDRRLIMASADNDLLSGQRARYALALVTTNRGANSEYTCPNAYETDILKVADTAWKVWWGLPPTGVKSIAANNPGFKVYPNPAQETVTIDMNMQNSAEQLCVYNITGKRMHLSAKIKNNKTELDVSNLPAGMYHIVYNTPDARMTGSFVKQ